MRLCKSLYFKGLVLALVFILGSSGIEDYAEASSVIVPQYLTIDIEDRVVGKFDYDDFFVNVKKIGSRVGVGYCLELEKDYPHGERFIAQGNASDIVNTVLSNGYPNRSASEIGVEDDDQAYLVTQAVLWTLFEDYDVNMVTTGNGLVDKAIINVYNNVINNVAYTLTNDTTVYRCNDDSIQSIVIYISKPIEIKPVQPVGEVPPIIDSGVGGVNDSKSDNIDDNNINNVNDNATDNTNNATDNGTQNIEQKPVGKGRA